MSLNLPSHYARQYADTVMLLTQQKGSRLRPAVTEAMYKGEQASPVDQVGAIEMQEVTTRFGDMGRVDAAVDRRWIFPSSYDLPQLVDHNDELRLITDPKSKYVENGVAAVGRRIDRTILSAALGTNYTGKTGTTSTSFLAGNIIDVDHGASGAVGLTVKKLRQARKILMSHNVDLDSEPLYCAAPSLQLDSLLAEAQVISLDFNEKPVLVDGKVTRFLGFQFIHTEILAETGYLSSGDHQVLAWCKSGLHLGLWEDMKQDIDRRKDLTGLPWQVYMQLTLGATRIEEKKVVNIKCEV